MKTTNLQPITIVEELEISDKLSRFDSLARTLNRAKFEYEKIFNDFDLEKFLKIFTAKNIREQITLLFIEEKNYDFRGLKVRKLMERGEIEMPSTLELSEQITYIHRSKQNLPFLISEQDVASMFCAELNKFPESGEKPEMKIFERVRAQHTYQTQNDEEVEHLQQVLAFAKMFLKLSSIHYDKDFNLKTHCGGLFSLFSITENDEIRLKPRVLMAFRRNNQ